MNDANKEYKERYGDGSYSGRRGPDYARCADEVPVGWFSRQCSRKRGYGPDGAYCKQHAKSVERQRRRIAGGRIEP